MEVVNKNRLTKKYLNLYIDYEVDIVDTLKCSYCGKIGLVNHMGHIYCSDCGESHRSYKAEKFKRFMINCQKIFLYKEIRLKNYSHYIMNYIDKKRTALIQEGKEMLSMFLDLSKEDRKELIAYLKGKTNQPLTIKDFK